MSAGNRHLPRGHQRPAEDLMREEFKAWQRRSLRDPVLAAIARIEDRPPAPYRHAPVALPAAPAPPWQGDQATRGRDAPPDQGCDRVTASVTASNTRKPLIGKEK